MRVGPNCPKGTVLSSEGLSPHIAVAVVGKLKPEAVSTTWVYSLFSFSWSKLWHSWISLERQSANSECRVGRITSIGITTSELYANKKGVSLVPICLVVWLA